MIEASLSPEYVLDKMQLYEIPAILERLQFNHRDSWEQTRMIMYVIAQSNSKKKLSPSDIMRFPWEEKTDERPPEPTEEEVNALKEKMEQFIKNKNSCQQI